MEGEVGVLGHTPLAIQIQQISSDALLHAGWTSPPGHTLSPLDLYLDQSPWNSLVVWMQEVVLPDGSSL